MGLFNDRRDLVPRDTGLSMSNVFTEYGYLEAILYLPQLAIVGLT